MNNTDINEVVIIIICLLLLHVLGAIPSESFRQLITKNQSSCKIKAASWGKYLQELLRMWLFHINIYLRDTTNFFVSFISQYRNDRIVLKSG